MCFIQKNNYSHFGARNYSTKKGLTIKSDDIGTVRVVDFSWHICQTIYGVFNACDLTNMRGNVRAAESGL